MSFTLSEVLTLVLPALTVIAVITALVYAGSARQSKRYRPGRPFEFAPVWFLSAPERLTGEPEAAAHGVVAGLPQGPRRAELASAGGPVLAQREAAQQTGGASDRW